MTLIDRIRESEARVLRLAGRQFTLEALKSELERITRGKEFRVWNDIAWQMVFDTVDMLVIDLCSWAKSVYERGGLLGQIQGNHREELRHASWPVDRLAAYKRLFSCMCDAGPTNAAFTAIRDTFEATMEPVCRDRNANRAHRFESGHNKNSAKMLDVPELRQALSRAERFMHDLELVAGFPESPPWRNLSATDAEEAAADLADTILLGTSPQMKIVRGGEERDSFYSAKHVWHDSLPPGRDMLFNDNSDE
jgi:hypothetical protein